MFKRERERGGEKGRMEGERARKQWRPWWRELRENKHPTRGLLKTIQFKLLLVAPPPICPSPSLLPLPVILLAAQVLLLPAAELLT